MRIVCTITALTLAASISAQEAHDWRIVNGITVDLGPVHKWLADHEGERPMQHWKQLRVTEITGAVGTWWHCAAKNESGKSMDIYINNLPAQTLAFFQSVKDQYTAITNVRAVIEDNTRKIRVLDGQIPKAAWGDSSWVNNVMSQRRQLEAWKANVETAKEELAKLETKYNSAIEQAPEKVTVLAMFGGRKYLELEIWDCGKPR